MYSFRSVKLYFQDFLFIKVICFPLFASSNPPNSQPTSYQRRFLVTRSGRKIKGRGPRVGDSLSKMLIILHLPFFEFRVLSAGVLAEHVYNTEFQISSTTRAKELNVLKI